ncbi:MAG TPA: hypothetical protein VMZ27_17935 [Candidatus Saccharimonadales bacterium]|nr:hypothetical protein [Candidatus Saccharimonadales bacterium]
MRRLLTSLGAVTLLAMAGCSTTNTVSQMEGRGTKVVYNAPFDPTWRAAIDAAQQGDLHVINADPATGYISAKRGVQMETFGENVGIWVTRQGPTQTGVEVVSRQSGPPVLWLRNWEKRVQQSIAANLTREGVGYAAPMSGTISGGTPPQAPVYVAPPPATTLPPTTTYSNSDSLQTQIDTLQQRQYEREQELKREQDLKRRAALQDDIDMLKADLHKLQQRLRQLEQEQRNTQ